MVFGSVGAVNLVVAAHNRFGLRFLYRRLKRREINFPECPLGQIRRAAHALVFLIVCGIMLHACAHVFALHAPDIGSRHFPGQIRVLGQILEIAPAQRTSLDIYRRSQEHA